MVTTKIQENFRARSVALLHKVENRLSWIMTFWFVVAIAASVTRVAYSPLTAVPDLGTVLPYALLVCAPLVSLGLSLKWFGRPSALAQPRVRLARVGRWTDVPLAEARQHRLYGSSGIMVSLLIGMLLNVPVRSLEYMASVPALAGDLPHWLSTLRAAMTFDVVLLTSLYTICFVAALKRVPMFPRLLAATWVADLAMQVGIAKAVAAAGPLPEKVATALTTLLDGNVTKVLISVGLWLPYLILSERVNVTFRNRVATR